MLIATVLGLSLLSLLGKKKPIPVTVEVKNGKSKRNVRF